MLYFILLLLWSIAECKPMNKQQGTHDPQLVHIVQELMQKHDNNNPTLSWEEESAANSRPCSNEEIISGMNYDYYIQYVDMNENYDKSYLEDIDHVDISEPMMFRCRPVMYCAEVKSIHPYVSAPRNRHSNVNRKKDDCFVLTQNGKTPYPSIPHNKQQKPNITAKANNLQNKTTTEPTLSLPQTSTNSAVSEQLHYDPRHMYISVHNNINMGRNEQIYSQTYKENINQQSNATVDTPPIQINSTNKTFTTAEIPGGTNATVGVPHNKDFSLESKYSLEHNMHEKQKSHMKILLDFLATFKKKLCNDSVEIGNNLPNTADLIALTTTIPNTVNVTNSTLTSPLSTKNKTISDDDVIFVIKKNKSNANDTSINLGDSSVDIKQNNKPLAEPVQTADKDDSIEIKLKKNTKFPKSHSKSAEIDKLKTNRNSAFKSGEESVGAVNVNNYPTARRRNNYGNTKTGYILESDRNNGRPYYRKQRIQPHYNYNANYNKAGRIAKPQRLNQTPKTFYWNDVVRRRYNKASEHFQPTHRLKELPLEICNSESMNQSKLDSIDCDEQTADRSTESKDYRDYKRPNYRRQYINYMKRLT